MYFCFIYPFIIYKYWVEKLGTVHVILDWYPVFLGQCAKHIKNPSGVYMSMPINSFASIDKVESIGKATSRQLFQRIRASLWKVSFGPYQGLLRFSEWGWVPVYSEGTIWVQTFKMRTNCFLLGLFLIETVSLTIVRGKCASILFNYVCKCL